MQSSTYTSTADIQKLNMLKQQIEKNRNVALNFPFLFGILLMLITTGLWALAFVAPLALENASSIEIALGRFIVYGLVSILTFNLRRFISLPPALLMRAITYALTGNIIYYFLLVLGIQLGGATLAVLVIGMLPVTVSITGQFAEDKMTISRLIWPLCIFVIGIVLYNAAKSNFFNDLQDLSLPGLLCLFASLVMWTWYAVNNAKFLARTKSVTGADWSSIIGITSFGISLIALPISWSLGIARDPFTLGIEELFSLMIWSIVLGVGSTWVGTILFNIASKKLKTSILGQLIIFESVFGIFYIFLFSNILPSLWEFVGISIALTGVWLSIRVFQKE